MEEDVGDAVKVKVIGATYYSHGALPDLVAVMGTACLCFSSRRRHTRLQGDWSSDVCSSDLESTKSLSEAQWNFKPAPDRWSVAQVMEHIAAAEDFILGMVKEKVMMAPAGEPGRDVKKTDEGVLAMIPDRTNKVQAPEPLVPTNRFGSPQGSVKHFAESRATTEDFLKSATGLRDHVTDSPMGKLDGYEFVLLIAAHSERHTKQINEVKADPNFPKK